MVSYSLRRLLLAVSIVWAISFGSFVAFALSFDPTYMFNLCTTQDCLQERNMLIQKFHLHQPILERYWLWLEGLFSHGFGTTVLDPDRYLHPGVAIGPLIWPAAAVTAQLLLAALVVVILLSIVVGVAGARRPGSPLDVSLRFLAYVSWSMPTFLVGVLVWRWLGPTGWFFDGRPGGGVVHWVRAMTLPALTLSLGLIGVYSRYIRSAMIVSLQQPYAVVARAKGLPERRVVYRHALRNSLIPFVNVVSLEFAAIVGASLATDYVFRMGGLAVLFLDALGHSDPFEMTSILVVIGGLVAVFMLLADLLIGWLDPRVRR